MAITRAQIAKQLLAQGGRIGLQGGGRDAGKDSDFGQEDFGGPKGGGGDGDRNRIQTEKQREFDRQTQRALTARFGDPDPEVDVITANRRDTATNFLNNLLNRSITRKGIGVAVPQLGLLDAINVARMTGQVRDELGIKSPTFNNDDDEGEGEGQPIILPRTMMAQAPSITEQEPEETKGLFRRFKAEGGIMNSGVVGGEFDFESARQAYGLGKLVKKIGKTVKKIAKSPIGKAALAFGAYKLGGMGFGKDGLSLFERFGNLTALQKAGVVGSGILTAAPFFMKPEEEDEEEQDRGEGLDIARIRANPNQFLARRFVAEGGSMKEPVAKKTMPLLDLDGKEMDLRAEGGFVPIGRMEKADDVPARLSKNEFVFTADAVRNAGDGDVDKGAEVMYNMMKNLESGGDVSKESQGLEGARRMFQTSQRLEEVL
jgi:hypothetical protein